MRAFVILSIIAVASAGRLGYNYQQGFSGSNDITSSGSGISSTFLGGGHSVGGGQGLGFSGNSGFGGGFGTSGGFGQGGGFSVSGGSSGSSGSFGSSGGTNQVIDGGLTKEFFTFSAPEEEHREGQSHQSTTTQIKKNLRVIFIKAPEHNAVHNSALQLIRKATEDKTAIYVLSKEPDVQEITNTVQEISENVRAKPEVRFIKYRTQQDALNAQQTIQQQYEALGGTSHSSNEGVAPVLNFASPAKQSTGHGIGVSGGSSFTSQSVDLGSIGSGSSLSLAVNKSEGGSYLPPAVK